MARYNKLSNKISIAPASVPNVSVSMDDPVARVELASSRSLDARVGQLQKLFTNMATQQATAEGLRYGAMSAPTQEQIELAESTGKPISVDDLAGDPNSFNVFQQAARKGALAVTESRFTGAARRALTDVYINATTNKNVSPADLQGQLDDVVLSFSSSLSDVDPLSGAKVDASLSLVANSMMQTYSKTFATRQATANKSAALARVPGHIEGIKAVIGAGGDDYQTKVSALRSVLANDLNNAGVTASKYKTVMASVDTAIQSTIGGVVQNYARDLVVKPADSLAVLKQFDKGTFEDKHINNLVTGLKKNNPDAYAKLRSTIRSDFSAQAALVAQIENEKITKAQKDQAEATDKAYEAMADGRLDEARQLLPFMSGKDRFDLKAALEAGGRQSPGDQITLNSLTELSNNSAISVAVFKTAVNTALKSKKITYTEANQYIAKYKTKRDQRVSLVTDLALSRLRMSPEEMEAVGRKDGPEKRRKKAIFHRFTGDLSEALLLDPDTNPLEFFNRKFIEIRKQENAFILGRAKKESITKIGFIRKADETFPLPPDDVFESVKGLEAYILVLRDKRGAEKNAAVKNYLTDLIEKLMEYGEATVDD